MSCCGGNCGCGSDCKCGNGCKGCKMYPDLTERETTARTLVIGVGLEEGRHSEEAEVAGGSENGGCMCGSSCTCDPCHCK